MRPAVEAPPVQAQIIVRRPRLPRLPAAAAPVAASAEPAPEAETSGHAPSKPARVFRLEPAMPGEALATPSTPQPEPESPAGGGAAPMRPARRRRSPDKRPGPVRHAVLPVPPAPPEAPSAPQRLKDLGLALARLDPVFEEIERARAFVFVDARFDPAWKALSERADSLRAELHAPRPWRS